MEAIDRKQKATGNKQKTAGGRASAVYAVVLAFGATFQAELPIFARSGADATITARVYNYANVSSGEMGRAEAEAGRIIGAAGVQMLWLDCPTLPAQLRSAPPAANPDCAGQPDPATVILRILPGSSPAKAAFRDTIFGFADGSALASVFYYGRIVELTRGMDEAEWETPITLGHAIAHEVGHLLLGPNAHSLTGIMCGRWDRKYLQQALMGLHIFTTSQSELLRAAVRERNKETAHTSPRTPSPGVEKASGRVTSMPFQPLDSRLSYRLVVRLHNYARVEPAVLTRAKDVAGQAFRVIGIELVWLDVPLTGAELAKSPGRLWEPGGAVVDVNILPRSMTVLAKLPQSVVGTTPMMQEGECVTNASVYYDRIERAVRYTAASTSQILGYAIAHELGHMLLRTTHHSSTGIMMAKWRPVDLQRAARGQLGFTPQQAESIRAETAAREKVGQGGAGPLENEKSEARSQKPE